MNFDYWKVRMERWITDGESPEVKIKSSFDYELPRDWSEMLDNIDMVDEAYRDSVFMGVMQHCSNKHGKSGFFPQELISPKV
jgi:hypothetical protein|tara:strand:- start:189 stop:434 length:246 start_codon:yes stop_codon:yes gene_type:complete